MQDAYTVIQPKTGFNLLDLRELKDYRDLFVFMVWREIKVIYAQTILGLSWALLQPLIQIVIFTVVFGKVADVPTDGIPYFLFSTVAIIPWTYMSSAMSSSSQSLVIGQNMLGKVYFPRLIFPMTPVFSKMVDFTISLLIVIVVMIAYKVMPTWNIMLLPLFVAVMILVPSGIGLWLSAMAIRFRDVKHAMPFIIRMLIYTAPIVYSATRIPEHYRLIYSLNPIVAVIEGFRSCILGTPFLWQFILPGMATAILLFLSGVWYFKKMERVFVDVI
jgi:lipopolysaccharide transport system permease protein